MQPFKTIFLHPFWCSFIKPAWNSNAAPTPIRTLLMFFEFCDIQISCFGFPNATHTKFAEELFIKLDIFLFSVSEKSPNGGE